MRDPLNTKSLFKWVAECSILFTLIWLLSFLRQQYLLKIILPKICWKSRQQHVLQQFGISVIWFCFKEGDEIWLRAHAELSVNKPSNRKLTSQKFENWNELKLYSTVNLKKPRSCSRRRNRKVTKWRRRRRNIRKRKRSEVVRSCYRRGWGWCSRSLPGYFFPLALSETLFREPRTKAQID